MKAPEQKASYLPGVDRPYTNAEALTLRRLSLLFLDPSLDLIVRSFLQANAAVNVAPVSTDAMTGMGTQAVNDILGTGAVSARQYAQRNQKIQTQAVEWMQWKQWALNHKDFDRYRLDFVADIPRLRMQSSQFLISDMGQSFLAYETFPGRRISRILFLLIITYVPFFALAALFGLDMGSVSVFFSWPAAFLISQNLQEKYGITIVEWFMQRVLGKPPLACGPLKGQKYSERSNIIRQLVASGRYD